MSMPSRVVLLTLAISPLGAWARTVFCTAGGRVLKSWDAFSRLRLQPTTNPAAVISVTRYAFMRFVRPFLEQLTYATPPQKWVKPDIQQTGSLNAGAQAGQATVEI